MASSDASLLACHERDGARGCARRVVWLLRKDCFSEGIVDAEVCPDIVLSCLAAAVNVC